MSPTDHGHHVPRQAADDTLEAVRQRIRSNLAGFERLDAEDEGERRAAVAITVTTDQQGHAAFLLTKRPATIRRHAGQWALPGGRLDEGESVVEAALRELDEELGVRRRPEHVIGRLDDYATRSGFRIAPVVVWAGTIDRITPEPEEVAQVVHVRLSELDREDAPQWLDIDGARGPVIVMPVHDHGIHAPTAAILYQFREAALHGRPTRVAHFDEPPFAWK